MSFSLVSRDSSRPHNQFAKAKNKTIDIYVDEGSFESPYYSFYDSKSKKIPEFIINLKQKYRFHRLDDVTSHPFYLSHSGEQDLPGGALKFRGKGDANDGIIGAQIFSLSFKKRDRKLIKSEGFIQYFCTAHPVMTGIIPIKGSKISEGGSEDALRNLLVGPPESDSSIPLL